MFVSKDLKKLAIYIVEREVTPKKPKTSSEAVEIKSRENWFHTSLMLVDETGDKIAVLQELHYSDLDNIFYPNVTRGISPRVFNNPLEINVFPVIGGDELHMMNMWNRILAHASFVKDSEIHFGDGYKTDPFSSNCREGIIKALHSVGITSHLKMYKGVAGTQARGIPSYLPTKIPEQGSLTAVYAKNAELTKTLGINDTVGERITRPIKGYFPAIHGRMAFG